MTLTIDRNDDGAVTRITRSAADVVDRFEAFEYGDPERMFVTRTENALGHATRALTHPALGVVVASRDPNGVLTTRQINDRGMVTRIPRAGVAAVSVAYADRASNGIMTPDEAALVFLRPSLAPHTEARAVRSTPLQAGDSMTIQGQYRPCPSCKGAMKKAAFESGASMQCKWEGRTWIAGGGEKVA